MRFAILTDTHIRSPKGDLSSPFPVNEKANARAEYAVGMLKAAEPEFTIHLGDVIHPLPHMPSAPDAIAEAKRILDPLLDTMKFVPGNHDIGDKPSKLMPAGPVESSGIAAYEALIGPQYQTFQHQDLQVFTINSSLINSGSPHEREQSQWLESQLQESRAAIKILFSHYPPFICTPTEADHYDNYAEPGRSWLLELAAKHGVNAIFSGHVHHFFYNRWQGIPLFCLPATSFTRQDYAELFPVSPANEYGRDDDGKFAVTMVEIENGKINVNIHNTNGNQGQYKGTAPTAAATNYAIPHLRHTWHLPKALPYNGPMEEFDRKEARNDYPLLRLLQLGIETVRIPGTDLLQPVAQARIKDWLALGKQVLPFCTPDTFAAVSNACSEISSESENSGEKGIRAIEVLLRLSDFTNDQQDSEAPNIFAASGSTVTDFPIWLSAITTSADNPDPDSTFAHSVTSGVMLHKLEKLAAIANSSSAHAVVVQVPWEADLEQTVQQALVDLDAHNLQLVVNLCLRCSNPADANFDVPAIAARYKAATKLAQQFPFTLQVDTFEDVDRGYGPRYGMIDRLANLREEFLLPD